MANAAGFIQESIWRDPDWRKLSPGAQRLYMQLLSQKELDCAGILPLQPDKWAAGCDQLTVEQVWADMEELQQARFAYYDTDTFEAFVRTYMRNSNVMKVPNMLKSARRSALLVGSAIIKPILAAELRAIGDPSCSATADQIHPETAPKPGRSKQKSEPFRNPSGTLPEGSGVGVGVGVTHLGSTKGGSARPECSKHPNGNSEEANCRGCMKRRQWDEAHAAEVEADELDAKRRARAAIAECPDCHGTHVVEVGPNRVRKCEHPQVIHA